MSSVIKAINNVQHLIITTVVQGDKSKKAIPFDPCQIKKWMFFVTNRTQFLWFMYNVHSL